MADDLLALAKTTSDKAVAVRNHLEEAKKLFDDDERQTQEKRATREGREINLIFALDATFSRSQFWDISKDIQATMFSTAARIRGKFSTQLVYYSGLTHIGKIVASPWYQHAGALSDEMEAVTCTAGGTQIGKVFCHAVEENCKRTVNALILVADSCEEHEQDLVPLARKIKESGIRFFLFDDRKGSTQSHPDTARIFEHITEAAGGEKKEFYMENIHVLGDYLNSVVAASTGDLESIEIARRNARTPEGRDFADGLARKVRLALPGAKL